MTRHFLKLGHDHSYSSENLLISENLLPVYHA